MRGVRGSGFPDSAALRLAEVEVRWASVFLLAHRFGRVRGGLWLYKGYIMVIDTEKIDFFLFFNLLNTFLLPCKHVPVPL